MSECHILSEILVSFQSKLYIFTSHMGIYLMYYKHIILPLAGSLIVDTDPMIIMLENREKLKDVYSNSQN